MAISRADVIQGLRGSIEALLPVPGDPALTPDVHINPVRFQPAGIGSVLALVDTPVPGEREAQRLRAQLVLRVKATDVAGLGTAEADATQALVGADALALRSRGIFTLTRDLDREDRLLEGIPPGATKDLHFDVLYEFRREPDAAGGTIDTLQHDVVLQQSDGALQDLFETEFDTPQTARFDVFDDAGATGGSNWQDAPDELHQTGNIAGGDAGFSPNKRGTYLVLRAGEVPRLARDFILTASVRADGAGELGLVFRFQDVDNYYFFLMGQPPTPMRLFGRKVADATAFLDSGGQDPLGGFTPGTWHLLRLAAQRDSFELAIDGNVVLSGQDDEIDAAGSIGLLCRGATTARFRYLRWSAL
jgi:hypothetical protein